MSGEAEICAKRNARLLSFRARFELFGTIAKFAFTQSIVQLATLVAGFLIIRALSKEQYAVYILASAGLGILTALSDSGITSATMSLIGHRHREAETATRYYLSARKLRWALFAAATITIIPLWYRLSRIDGTSYWTPVVCCIIVLMAGMCQLNYALAAIVPKLNQAILPLQRIALIANGLRLPVVIAIVWILPNPILFLLSNLMSNFLLAALSQKLNNKNLASGVTAETDTVREIWKRTLPQMPNSIFYCFFAQSALIIIALLGRDDQVADVGALGRLSVLFGVAMQTMATVVVPRFSRISDPKRLLARYAQTIAVQTSLSLLLFLFALLFPRLLLLILGTSYAGLDHIVKWSVLAALINSLTGTVWNLNASKGWVHWAWITIPLIVTTQIVVGFTVDLTSVRGAIMLSALPMIPAFLFLVAIGFRQLRRELVSGSPELSAT
jgi:O-antigen/teichoic acid export membrane protein